MYRQLLPLFFFLFSFVAAHAQQTERLIDNNPNYFYRGDQRPEGITAPADSNYMLISYYQIAPNGVSQFGTLGTPVWIHRDSLISRGFFDGIGGSTSIEAGAGIIVSGTGTEGDPYIITNTGGGGGDNIYTTNGTVLADRTVTAQDQNTFLNFKDFDYVNISNPETNDNIGLRIAGEATPSFDNRLLVLSDGKGQDSIIFYRAYKGGAGGFDIISTDITTLQAPVLVLRGTNSELSVSNGIFTDGNNSRGLAYAADYSANYGNRSIPDVEYVNSQVARTFTRKDTTVTTDFTVTVTNTYTVTSFCDDGVDNTIILPTPVDSLKGNVIEVTHLDTSVAQARTTTVETDGTSYHIYDNFTGDTLTFFNVYQSGQTVRFTLKEVGGVLRWVAVNLSPFVHGDKELTTVGKIRQGSDGDLYAYDSSVSGERKVQYQYTVDSVQEILSMRLELGDRVKVKSTGAEYFIQADSIPNYLVDTVAVLPLSTNFAVLQPQNNAYFIEWLGAVSGDTINDSGAIQKAINFSRRTSGVTITSQNSNSRFIVNDNINIDLFRGKSLYIEIQDTLYRAPSANSSGYLFSVNRSESIYFKNLTIASENEFPSATTAHNPAGCVDETCDLTSNFNGINIGNIGDNGNVIIDNCTFLNLGNAIDANGTQQITVSNSVMIGCYFGITGGGNSSIVVNNLFHGVDSLQTIENTPHTLYLNNYLSVAVNNLHCGGEYQGQMYSSLDTPIKIGNSASKDTASLNFNNINIFVPSTTDPGCSGRIVIEAIPVNSNWNNITSTNLVHSGPIFMSLFSVTKGVNASNVILNWPKSTGGTLLDFNAADQSANFSNLIVKGSAKVDLVNNTIFNCVNCTYENPRENIFTGTNITQTSYANYTNLAVSFIDSNSVNLFDIRNSIVTVDGLNIRLDNATASTIAEVREGSNVPRRFIRIHNAILDTLFSDVAQLIDTPGYTSTEPAFFIDGRYTDGSVISLSNTPYLDELDEIVLPKNIKSTGSVLFGTGQTQTTSISNGDIGFASASAIRKVSNNLLMASSPTYQRIQFYGSNHRVAVMDENGLSLASRPTEASNFPSATLDINGTFKLTGDADFPELDTLQTQNTTLRDTTAATAAFTIRMGEENHINTSGGSVTAQVPAGAQIGDVFSVYAGESAGTNSATIDFATNGYTILGASVSRILNTNFKYETYRYIGDGNWIIIASGP